MLLSINMIFPINMLSLVLSNVYCHQKLVGGRGMFHFIKQQMEYSLFFNEFSRSHCTQLSIKEDMRM